MTDRKRIRIVFMGTPEFAVASLSALVEAGFEVVAVVTAPDKPAGRGMKLQASAVKQYALEQGLPILQPVKLKDPVFLEQLQSFHADLQVVVAFRMLPEVVWNMPPMGTINVHGSLLPQYRGAAPINWAVIEGDTQTGVTTFQLQHQIDTGHILLQEAMAIGPNETAGEVHDRMKEIGAQLLVRTIDGLLDKRIEPQPQAELAPEKLRHAPKLYTETGQIQWEWTKERIYNLIRGLSPYPGATTRLQDKVLKIFKAELEEGKPTVTPGTAETDGKSYLRFACANGYLYAKDIQLEGKKRMLVTDFLRGYRPV